MEDKTLELMVSFGLDDYFLPHNIDVGVRNMVLTLE